MKVPARIQRRAVDPAADGLVRVSPLDPGHPIPALVTPAVPGLDLVEWAAGQRERIDALLREHKALLFRGFHRQETGQFRDFVARTSQGAPLEYVDRTTPRTRVADGVYTSTVYPADRRIHLHNEGTYWTRWPLKLYFGCAVAAATGGETPLAEVTAVLGHLRDEVRERFAREGFMLVRNYNDGFGLPWQEVFQTSEPGEVERYCHQHDIGFEWREGDRLRTWQVRPAIRCHPWSGEPVWFNHAAFFHLSTYVPEVRAGLLAEVGLEGLPYNTFYGDGAEIEPEVVAEIHRAYERETVTFPWQAGDILLLDNMSVAHGRASFTGERLILASMNEPYEPGTLD